MAKALKTAAIIVGAVALVATGVGAAASIGAFGAVAAGSAASATLATVATIASVASVASGVLSLAAGLTAKKPSSDATGSQTSFSADPDAGIPAALGRTGTAGNIVARFGWDTADKGDNDRNAFVSVLSLGPVAEIEPTLGVDRVPVTFDGAGRALGSYAGFMWRMTQRGLLTGAALTFGTGAGAAPGWTAQHKLSGKAATTWTLRFDTKAKLFQNGVPAPMNVVRGRLVYDPRKDSTYPGGSGSHRMADPANRAAYDAAVATWEYSENPYLHALGFVHGYWQRDMANASSDWQRVMGMGAPDAGIDYAAYVEGANIADANGWKVGGIIFSGDDKWGSLKKILQAGMGEPLALGAKISCLVNAPKVSLATITADDVVGDCSVGATQPRRDRINTITPRYRLEANNWQLLPGAPLSVAEHVATDKGRRSRTQDYPLIQSTPQVGTAVRYDIENAREFGPIVLPCKLVWMGYKPGDCVTVTLPEVGLNGQTVLLLNRELEPSGGVVTLTARSETAGKHAFALGQTATPPPTPGVTGAPVVPVPGEAAWAISDNQLSANGAVSPALVVTGAIDIGTGEAVLFEYRRFVSGSSAGSGWIGATIMPPSTKRLEIVSVEPGTAYEVAVSYRIRGVVGERRILGPVTTAGAQIPWNGVSDPSGNRPDDNATNSADPDSAFGPGGTVGGTVQKLSDFDTAIAAARAYQDVLNSETIPAINKAVTDAGDRITAARGVADRALDGVGAANTRIDDLIAEGGGGSEGVDTVARAEIRRVDKAYADADIALSGRVDIIQAGVDTVDSRIAAKAQEVTTAYTQADQALASRASVLETAASATSTSVVPNDNFNIWPDGQALPTRWGYWAVGGSFRVEKGSPGRGGGQYYVTTLNDATDVESGFVQTIYSSGSGKWVVEVTIGKSHGYLSGAGLLVGNQPLDFLAEPDIKGQTRDSGDGEVRSWTKLIDLDAGDTINVHAMHGWRGFGRTIMPKYIAWHCLRLRPANDAEIKAGKADAALFGTGGVLARIKTSEDTLADLPNRYATAQRATDIEASVGRVGGRVGSVETAVSDGRFATAVRAEEIASYAGDVDAKVETQAGTIARLDGKAAAYVRFVALAGNNRAQLTLSADANGGAGADLIGDLSISGNLLVTGSVYGRNIAPDTISGTASREAGSATFRTTALTTIARVDYVGNGGRAAITFSGIVTLSPGAPAGTRMQAYLSVNGGIRVGPLPVSATRGSPAPFCFSALVDVSGSVAIELSVQASGAADSGDPHIVDNPTIILVEMKKLGG